MKVCLPVFKSLFSASAVIALATALPATAQETAETDDVIVVKGGSQVDLSPAFDGEQVARGGRAGLLGNLDYMDAPFSGLAYTEQLIREQQSTSVGDVLQNDPGVRVAKGFGNFQELYVVRGFPVYSDDMTYNGVYGILPRQFVAAELVERVEVFRGANSFLNGAAPGGSAVGGAFNLVPKRATAEPLTRLTLGYENAGQFYGAADIARRFGEGNDFGVRFNAVRRDGETSIEDQERELTVLSIGTDYRGDRLRFSADLGYQDHRIDAPRPQVTPLGDVPSVPDSSDNYAQPWTYTDEEQVFGVIRGEFDVTDLITAWVAVGGRYGEEANVLANPSAAADGTTSAYRFDNTREDEILSADTGFRAEFATGSIGHRLTVSASAINLESRNAYAFSSFAGFAGDLYEPMAVTPPAADFFVGGDLGDPGKTEEVENSSIAIADMMSFLDGKLLATVGLRHQDIETASFDYNTGAELSRYSDSAVTPVFGVVYKPQASISLYANYAESLQPGAIAPATSGGTPINNAGEVLEPYRGEQIEAGIKYDAGSFGGVLSVFNLSQPNAIVVDQVFTDSGEQETTGLELTVFGEPAEGFRLLGGMTWLDSELSRTQGGVNEGNQPIGVPEFQANVNATYDVAAVTGLSIDGRIVFTGEQYVDAANTTTLDSWTRLDLGASYKLPIQSQDLTLRARIQNVTDEAYWASTGGFPGANYLVQGSPRTFILSLSADL
ncbi:TonB-dependent receptor [Parvularcula marina]|uniref:TonB-dependent receptor n=1 Tax=Parvularcula marina TaxID=2292771 RepID=UPI003514AC0E